MTQSHRYIKALAATAAALLLGLAATAAKAATQGTGLRGTAPSGAHYRFAWNRDHAKRFCERLTIEHGGDRSQSRNCQPARGKTAHGLWSLDCRSLDFVVYGTAYRRNARISYTPDGGGTTPARRRTRGTRTVFVLLADGHTLPGRVTVRSRSGRLLRTLRFDAADELCSGEPDLLEVTYTF
jgi:hypothetical protein